MHYEEERSLEAENTHIVERVVRGSVSIAIVVTVLTISSISSYALFALTQIAIYAGLTAFVGWDPVYAALKRNTLPAPVRAPSPVVSYPKRGVKHATSGHQQAA